MILILATLPYRILHFKVLEKSTKPGDFLSFLEETRGKINEDEQLKQELKNNKIWQLLDNATIHKTKLIKGYTKKEGINVLYSVPSSRI